MSSFLALYNQHTTTSGPSTTLLSSPWYQAGSATRVLLASRVRSMCVKDTTMVTNKQMVLLVPCRQQTDELFMRWHKF